MSKSKRLKTRDKRITTCGECKTKLTKYRLDGEVNGKQLSFCTFACHDKYVDREESASQF